MRKIVVFDLDGTLSDGQHRLYLLPSRESAGITHAWDDFNLASAHDTPIRDNIELLKVLYHAGHKIVILTGRSAVARQVTICWLLKHYVPYDRLIMRGQDDHRRDVEFKEGELRTLGLDNILCCFDDLEHVCKHIRGLGVTCHQVIHYDTPQLHTSDHREITS